MRLTKSNPDAHRKIAPHGKEESQKEIDKHRAGLENQIKETKAQIKPEIDSLAKDITDRILGAGA